MRVPDEARPSWTSSGFSCQSNRSPKKSPSFRMPIVASLPISDTTASLTFPYLYIENSIRRIPLSKDGLPSRKIFDLSSAVDGRKKCLGIEFGEFLRCRHECHNLVPH